MAQPLERVRPGDLISAVFINSLLDKISALEGRVEQLEGSGSSGSDVVITDLVFTAPLRVGDEMQIEGRNFDYMRGAQRVRFDSTPVIVFKTGSNDNLLVIEVPEVPGLSEAGTPVTITVINPTSTATRQVTLRPHQDVQQGNVSLDFMGVSPARIVAGQVDFTYRVAAHTLLTTSVTITPTISLTAVQGSLQVLSGTGAALEGRRLSLEPGQTKLFIVRVPAFPTLANGTAFTLQVAVAGAGIAGQVDGPQTFKFNEMAEQPDDNTFLDVISAIPATALVEGNGKLRLARSATATVKIQARFTETGSYTLVLPTPANWTITASDENPASPFAINTAPSVVPLDFTIGPTAAASGTTPAAFTVERTVGGTTVRRTTPLALEVTP